MSLDALDLRVALPEEGRRRVVIEHVTPDLDNGRYPIKRTPGEVVRVEADIFSDGHDVVAAVLRYRRVASASRPPWLEVAMEPLGNDRWSASFTVDEIGRYEYDIEGWVDHFASWHHALARWVKAGENVTSELLEGALLVRAAAVRATAADDQRSLVSTAALLSSDQPLEERAAAGLSADLVTLMGRAAERRAATRCTTRRVLVERERARFSSWYEMFPRSAGGHPTRSATFREAASRLPEIATMGFDVLYLPPIHPIGRTNRKGRDNTLVAEENDPGSPWAIGGVEGGHTAIEPGLGTIEDFSWFRQQAEQRGLEIALDLAYQVSPDHPYASRHPEWFRRRPDGTLKYAENPPKKYQDIYPFDFESDAWPAMWIELRDVVLFWVGHGVRIFRVDNPHTKTFRFWEWLIADVQSRNQDVIFLAEAFTRPKVMRHLAKIGFTQSYTYFTWRNTKAEIEEYFTELTQTDMQDYFRPNLFTNTPDILHRFLQSGGLPAFRIRLVLAATLGASYGIYSSFELGENRPAGPGSEEYLHSEKYQFRQWPLDSPHHIKDLIAQVNAIRRTQPALQYNHGLRFHLTTHEDLIAYSKIGPGGASRILMVVSLSPDGAREGRVCLSLPDQLIPEHETYTVHDLLSHRVYTWSGPWNFVRLDPELPAHIFAVHRSAAAVDMADESTLPTATAIDDSPER
ncbi:MAG: alpha-1,4-glucan--maltose-1-phosphate maltosyltransferase [Acidobacteria bacterium]|nr:alpha-1,4-glucan--maltose-1-phosphate maltosyltransferase [Acidobacteriota bacterium]